MAKQSIYHREVEFLEKSKAFLKKSGYSREELQLEYKHFPEVIKEILI